MITLDELIAKETRLNAQLLGPEELGHVERNEIILEGERHERIEGLEYSAPDEDHDDRINVLTGHGTIIQLEDQNHFSQSFFAAKLYQGDIVGKTIKAEDISPRATESERNKLLGKKIVQVFYSNDYPVMDLHTYYGTRRRSTYMSHGNTFEA